MNQHNLNTITITAVPLKWAKLKYRWMVKNMAFSLKKVQDYKGSYYTINRIKELNFSMN